MSKESKILFFRDKKDYIKELTSDDIINITGEKGSGKSFFGNMKDNDDNCVVIHLDAVFFPEGSASHETSNKLNKILIDKYKDNLNADKNFEDKYYEVLVSYLKNSGKTGYIEGGSISEMKNISNIKGKVVVKRTGVIKCFYRTIKRDYKNKYFMELEKKTHGKFAKITRLYKVIKRRKKIFKSYHEIEKFIEELEKYD